MKYEAEGISTIGISLHRYDTAACYYSAGSNSGDGAIGTDCLQET